MRHKKNFGYVGIAGISVILRALFMPNPFEMMSNGMSINWIFSAILPFIVFGIVGLFYKKGSAPIVGSVAFLLVYIGIAYATLYTMKFADLIGMF